jgi:hypothetical protein
MRRQMSNVGDELQLTAERRRLYLEVDRPGGAARPAGLRSRGDRSTRNRQLTRGQPDLPAQPAAAAEDPVQLLAQLARLHTQGVLSDFEFDKQKARLLGE